MHQGRAMQGHMWRRNRAARACCAPCAKQARARMHARERTSPRLLRCVTRAHWLLGVAAPAPRRCCRSAAGVQQKQPQHDTACQLGVQRGCRHGANDTVFKRADVTQCGACRDSAASAPHASPARAARSASWPCCSSLCFSTTPKRQARICDCLLRWAAPARADTAQAARAWRCRMSDEARNLRENLSRTAQRRCMYPARARAAQHARNARTSCCAAAGTHAHARAADSHTRHRLTAPWSHLRPWARHRTHAHSLSGPLQRNVTDMLCSPPRSSPSPPPRDSV